jgi:hypothetical protein
VGGCVPTPAQAPLSTPLEIPLFFHVLYCEGCGEGAPDIPNSTLYAQVTLLNEEFAESSTGFSFRLIGISRTMDEDWALWQSYDQPVPRAAQQALSFAPRTVLNVYITERCDAAGTADTKSG